jgi:hypothetical protein
MKLLSNDIETLYEDFLIKIHDYQEDKWYTFAINKWRNDLFAFVKFVEETTYLPDNHVF